jgi:hypothetical protein
MILEIRAWPMLKADKLTAICEIVRVRGILWVEKRMTIWSSGWTSSFV